MAETINHLPFTMGFLNVERPVRLGGYRTVLAHHLPPALIAGGVLLAVALLRLDRIPYTICTFLRLTGYPCPSCGLTRGFVAMAHGQWLSVLHACPLAALLYAATALVFAVNAAALLCGVRLTPGRHVGSQVATCPVAGRRGGLKWRASAWVVFLCFFGLLILLNWLYRLALGLK